MSARSSTYNGNWIFNHNTGVYVGKYMGLIESSGHARGGKAPRHTTADHALLLRLRFGNGEILAVPLASLTQTENPVTYASPPRAGY